MKRNKYVFLSLCLKKYKIKSYEKTNLFATL